MGLILLIVLSHGASPGESPIKILISTTDQVHNGAKCMSKFIQKTKRKCPGVTRKGDLSLVLCWSRNKENILARAIKRIINS